jgi:ferredoxin-NADP reductase
VLFNELDSLTRMRDATLHVLTGRTSESNNPFAPASLQSLVPDIAGRDIYICGPEKLTVALLKSLAELGVPKNQIHAERFRLAG